MTRPVVVITGASRGIGKQLAIDFAAGGYDVACLARSAKGAEGKLPGTIDETAEEVQKAGGKALALSVDVRSEEQVEEAAKRVYEELGRCDVLINNAAVGIPGRTLEVSTKNWRLGVDINVNGAYYMINSFCRRMLDAGEGRVINISTMVAWAPEFGRINYMVTKRALEALTEGAAYDFRGKIAVNCIRLEVMVWTEGFAATLGDVDRSGFEHPVIMSDAALWIAKQPLDYTGHIVTISDLREMGVVRGVTPA
ncbi:MAG TPA: SDR family NAD(P)-dependent oxidoreductase [Dehalococcoidia bacterium]|jgi:citronellol/citronellal dehydrogenase|nr:SDR family NAD(P)-dependent oxidoreductase [Dehalococcoidia bacterium]